MTESGVRVVPQPAILVPGEEWVRAGVTVTGAKHEGQGLWICPVAINHPCKPTSSLSGDSELGKAISKRCHEASERQ